jgi:hypothetical protein
MLEKGLEILKDKGTKRIGECPDLDPEIIAH